MTNPMEMWTIYASPADFPSVPFVVRGWIITESGGLMFNGAVGFADTLDQARGYIPAGLVCMARSDDDEPQIVETWL